MPVHSTTIFTLAYLLPLSLAHLPQQQKKHYLNMLSSKTNALLPHTLASFWRKQSCFYLICSFFTAWRQLSKQKCIIPTLVQSPQLVVFFIVVTYSLSITEPYIYLVKGRRYRGGLRVTVDFGGCQLDSHQRLWWRQWQSSTLCRCFPKIIIGALIESYWMCWNGSLNGKV